MGSKAKVRFYVRSGDIESELFSVRELTNGDLIVTLKHNIFYETPEGQYEKILEYRYSVHRSLGSKGRTITATVVLQSGRIIRSVAFIECGGDPFLWFLFSRRHPELIEGVFPLTRRAKDHLIKAAPDFDPKGNNLITHVVVSDRNHGPSPWRSHTPRATFRYFEIAVMPAYFAAPSIPKGDTIQIHTSSAHIGDEILLDVPTEPAKTLDGESLSEAAHAFNARHVEKFRQRIIGQADMEGVTLPPWQLEWIDHLTSTLSNGPHVKMPKANG